MSDRITRSIVGAYVERLDVCGALAQAVGRINLYFSKKVAQDPHLVRSGFDLEPNLILLHPRLLINYRSVAAMIDRMQNVRLHAQVPMNINILDMCLKSRWYHSQR